MKENSQDMARGVMSFTLATLSSVHNKLPGSDGLMGTSDDVTVSGMTTLNMSETNSSDRLSYNAFDFAQTNGTENGLPANMDAVSFLSGTVTADAQVAAAGGGTLITGWTLSGSQPFSGHGAYSSTITKVNSGTYNPANKALALNVDISATLAGGNASASGLALTGEGYLVLAEAFDTHDTGSAYVDDVLVPAAKAASAKALFFATASGTVPASTGGGGGGFPMMPIKATLVGFSQ